MKRKTVAGQKRPCQTCNGVGIRRITAASLTWDQQCDDCLGTGDYELSETYRKKLREEDGMKYDEWQER